MKINFTLLLLFISISVFSQEIGIGTVWTYSNYSINPFPGEILTGDYTITGEEVIDGKTYFAFDNFGSCGPSASHLRIEDRKYYMIIDGSEGLIHDFNLLPGESYLIKNYVGYDTDSLEIVIDSIGETIVDGVTLFTQYCSISEENLGVEWNLTFIENVGSIGFLLPQYGACDPGAGGLRCISYTDGQTIKFTSDDQCEIFYGNSYFQDGSQWFFGKWGLPLTSEIAQIIIEKDTITNSGYFQIMEILDEDENSLEDSQVLLTSEDNRVYFIENSNLKLLFDFSYNLEIGDTATYYLPENANLYDISSNGGIEPIINPYRHVISGIDTVISSTGQELRRWQVDPIVREVDGEPIGNWVTEIIEGVGPTGGFMRRGLAQLLSGEPESFRCFFSNQFNYTEISEGECDGLSDGLISIEPAITISPNPGYDYFQIKTEVPYKLVSVFDIHGQLVKTFQPGEDANLNGLASGVYFFQIHFEQGSVNRKVVKI
ncbi:MAG: hypothetical protein ACJA1A_001132 [Saprospiraceae bacterium]|jgi:hypothetical protein|tara:strand:- start:666 stop:2129 length:1464 start_codon:yes stop_codon:yes gene_type:complete